MLVFNSHGAPVRFGACNNADSYQTVSLFACKALNLAASKDPAEPRLFPRRMIWPGPDGALRFSAPVSAIDWVLSVLSWSHLFLSLYARSSLIGLRAGIAAPRRYDQVLRCEAVLCRLWSSARSTRRNASLLGQP